MLKKHNMPFLFLLFFACPLLEDSNTRDITMPDIIATVNDPMISRDKNIILYQGIPFSGKLVETYDNGKIKSLSSYFNGRKNGKTESWYDDGQRAAVRYYQNGRKQGEHQGWWQNGRPKFVYTFVKGLHDGAFLEWYKNGQLAKSFNYHVGKESGEQKAWRENGDLYINLFVKDGRKYGLFKSKPCFTVKEGKGQYAAETH